MALRRLSLSIWRLIVTLALVLCVLIGVSACDNRPCLRGHYDYMPQYIGKTWTIVPIWECDEYGKAPTNG